MLAAFRAAFVAAAARAPVSAHTLRLAGHVVRLRFAGSALCDQVLGAFSQSRVEADAQPVELEVHLWDGQSTGVMAPRTGLARPGRRLDPAGSWRLGAERAPDYVTFSHGDQAFLWAAGPRSYPLDRRATPLRSTLSWWLARHGLHAVHAAAIAHADRGVLLAGHGGCGKSTTALRCLEDGLDFLGDDITVLDARAEPRVHALYGSAKVCRGAIRERGIVVAGHEPEDRRRTIYWLDGARPARQPSSARIRGVLLATLGEGVDSRLTPVRAAEALMVLAPSTLRVTATATGTQAGMLAACARLLRQVPAHRLHLGRDPRGVTEAVRVALERSL